MHWNNNCKLLYLLLFNLFKTKDCVISIFKLDFWDLHHYWCLKPYNFDLLIEMIHKVEEIMRSSAQKFNFNTDDNCCKRVKYTLSQSIFLSVFCQSFRWWNKNIKRTDNFSTITTEILSWYKKQVCWNTN